MRVEKTISGWRQTTLGNETRIRRGASPRPIDNPRWFSSDGPAWIRIADVTASVRQLLRTTQRLSSEGAMLSVSVSPGQVIMSIAATVGRPIIVGIDACIHDGFVVFDRHSRLDPGFLVHHLRQMEPYFTGQGQTGTQANINTQIVEASPLRLPSLAEQRTIAAVLDTIDDAIQKTEQIIAKLQQVKQGLLHDLLTRGIDDNGELRDPDRHPEQFQDSPLGRIPKGWNPRLLHEVAELRSGVAKNEGRAVRDPVLVHYLRVANVQDGYLDLSDMATICIGRADVDRFRVLPGDVLMNEGGDLDKLGRGTIWRGEFEPCIHQNHVFVVRCGCDLLPEFLDAWTLTRRARNYFLVAGKQTTNLASINRTALGRLPLVVPPRAEQQVLMERIAGAEKRSEVESANLRKLRLLKSGLSDDLLTGRVRTTSLPGFSA